MYTPEQFKVSDLPTLQADMQRWNFATLITPDATEGPQVTHLPLLLDRNRGRFGVLAGHMARANPHWKAFGRSGESLAIFHGPHGYISPRWYVSEIAVPTWNYVAVHIRGELRLLDDTALREVLDRLTATCEKRLAPKSPWKVDQIEETLLNEKLPYIVPVEMSTHSVDCTFKLSQNRSDRARVGAAEALSKGGTPGIETRALAELMEEFRNRRVNY